jgi:hypothetical protein
VRLLASAGLLVLAAGCGHGTGVRAHRPPASPPGPGAAAAPGTLSILAARNAYTATIVPLYPLAAGLADNVANHPAAAPAPAAQFAAQLRQVVTGLAGMTFPGPAAGSFSTVRADAAKARDDLARPDRALGSQAARYATATDLYALARQIGVLGIDLGLLPRL